MIYCLEQYIKKEQLRNKDKFYCDKCNCLQEAEKQVKLETLPKILIIQLKRFQMEGYIKMKKLNSFINIPLDIDINFLLKEKSKNSNNNTHYTLHSFVVHAGTKGDYGHYFTIAKIDEECWAMFNDEKCEIIKYGIEEFFGNPDENYRFSSPNCLYLLFYELEN